MDFDDDVVREIVSRQRAEGLANNYRGEKDTFTDIPPSLLSASDIKRYVEKTGLISPFCIGGGNRSRLKKASYEGRIGDCAYVFPKDSNEFVNILQVEKPLLVKANSIVFVECDLDFRLPRNIAVRFNLQIMHVHRGLLLGTGPLVDPGYWGKLCIPLHNLTNEDYEIPLDEGLIWVEFTKTTSDNDLGRIPLRETERQHWDIRKFILKASRQFNLDRLPIGIRSSIPDSATKAEDSANKAARDAELASKQALEAKKSSDFSRNVNSAGVLITILTIAGLWASFYFGTRSDINEVSSRVADLQKEISSIKEAIQP
ncbi:hypothetical protein [Mesorhizobium sp. WSM3626]|uniref:hypothetical protein n=1 Tax=Mesorhizobium sp. WSM3626 TaxID=1040987 RepID=UPI0012EB1786|nr:hypothetical protein [Mesorhizobium sp. WSM3626]